MLIGHAKLKPAENELFAPDLRGFRHEIFSNPAALKRLENWSLCSKEQQTQGILTTEIHTPAHKVHSKRGVSECTECKRSLERKKKTFQNSITGARCECQLRFQVLTLWKRHFIEQIAPFGGWR